MGVYFGSLKTFFSSITDETSRNETIQKTLYGLFFRAISNVIEPSQEHEMPDDIQEIVDNGIDDVKQALNHRISDIYKNFFNPKTDCNLTPEQVLKEKIREVRQIIRYYKPDIEEERLEQEALTIAEEILREPSSHRSTLDIMVEQGLLNNEEARPDVNRFTHMLEQLSRPHSCGGILSYEIKVDLSKKMAKWADKLGLLPEAKKDNAPIIHDPSPEVLHNEGTFHPLEYYFEPPPVFEEAGLTSSQDKNQLMDDFIKVTTWYADAWWLYLLLKRKKPETLTKEENDKIRNFALLAKDYDTIDPKIFEQKFEQWFTPETFLEKAAYFIFYKSLMSNFVLKYFSQIITKSTESLYASFLSNDSFNDKQVLIHIVENIKNSVFEHNTAVENFAQLEDLDEGVNAEIQHIHKLKKFYSKEIDKDINKYRLFEEQQEAIVEIFKQSLAPLKKVQKPKKKLKKAIRKNTRSDLKTTLNKKKFKSDEIDLGFNQTSPWLRKDILSSYKSFYKWEIKKHKDSVTDETIEGWAISFNNLLTSNLSLEIPNDKASEVDKRDSSNNYERLPKKHQKKITDDFITRSNELKELERIKKGLLKNKVPNCDLGERWGEIKENRPELRTKYQKYFYVKHEMKSEKKEQKISKNFAKLMSSFCPAFSFSSQIKSNLYLPSWDPEKWYKKLTKRAFTLLTVPTGTIACALLDLPYKIPGLKAIPKRIDELYLKQIGIGNILDSVLYSLLDLLTELMEARFCDSENQVITHNIQSALLEAIHTAREKLANLTNNEEENLSDISDEEELEEPSRPVKSQKKSALSKYSEMKESIPQLVDALLDAMFLSPVDNPEELLNKIDHLKEFDDTKSLSDLFLNKMIPDIISLEARKEVNQDYLIGIQKIILKSVLSQEILNNLGKVDSSSLKTFLDGLFETLTEAYETEPDHTETESASVEDYTKFANEHKSKHEHISNRDASLQAQQKRDVEYHDTAIYLEQEIDGLFSDINKMIKSGKNLPKELQFLDSKIIGDGWIEPVLTPQIKENMIQGMMGLLSNPLLARSIIYILLESTTKTYD